MLKVKLLKESLLHTKILSAFQTKMYVLLSLLYFKLALKFHTLIQTTKYILNSTPRFQTRRYNSG